MIDRASIMAWNEQAPWTEPAMVEQVARFLVGKMAIYRRYLFEIAPLFAGAIGLENVCHPEGFVKVLK